MTEQVLGDSLQGQTAAPVVNTPVAEQQAPAPRTFTQEQVNEIVGREKHAVRQSYQAQANAAAAAQAATQTPAVQAPNSEDQKKLVADEVKRQVQDATYQNQINSFAQMVNGKLQTERDSNPDFSTIEQTLNLPSLAQTNPHFVAAIGNASNTAGIMRELHKNPANYAALLQLMRDPATQAMGMHQIQQLNDSISQNKAALDNAQANNPNAPLSQVKNSVNTNGNGSMSVSDRRKTQSHRV